MSSATACAPFPSTRSRRSTPTATTSRSKTTAAATTDGGEILRRVPVGSCLPFTTAVPTSRTTSPRQSFNPPSNRTSPERRPPGSATHRRRRNTSACPPSAKPDASCSSATAFATLSALQYHRNAHAATTAAAAAEPGAVLRLCRRSWRLRARRIGISYALESAAYALRRRLPFLRARAERRTKTGRDPRRQHCVQDAAEPG